VPVFCGRRLQLGLFDVDDETKRLDAFASCESTETLRVEVDEQSLALIADNMGLHADSIVAEAASYVSGEFRAKAKGFSGSRLGDFGEILTYLVRSNDGESIERVDDALDAADLGGYPRPDFITLIRGQLNGVEVKSTEAVDYQDLLDLHRLPADSRHHCQLKPCRALKPLRDDALRQLGFTNEVTATQVVVHSGAVLPFPIKKGIAVGVLVRDGRIDSLVPDQRRFRTGPVCVRQARNCWLCLGTDKSQAAAIMVEMPNEPGRLPILDDAGQGAEWFAAYRNWRQALWAFVPGSAAIKGSALLAATRAWTARIADGGALGQRLLEHWTKTLIRSAHERGIVLNEIQEGLRENLDADPGGDERVRRVALQDAPRLVQQAIAAGDRARFALEPAGDAGSAGVLVDGRMLDVATLSHQWPAAGISQEQATVIMGGSLALVAKLIGEGDVRSRDPAHLPELKPVTANINGHALPLGWVVEERELLEWALHNHQFGRFPWEWPWPWMRAWVFPDGRTRVRARHVGSWF
jgi:hypothetical protein